MDRAFPSGDGPLCQRILYINVPDSSINELRTYYGDNLARLQEVKRKYDPENVFHFEQSIPPGGESAR